MNPARQSPDRGARLSQPQRAASASNPDHFRVTVPGEALRVGHPRSNISSRRASKLAIAMHASSRNESPAGR
jgi:hypothetical protein